MAYGDFSDVTEPGTYKIKAANSGESYEFVIADEVYDGLFADAIKMFYLQRCGSELEGKYAGDFAHDACHTQKLSFTVQLKLWMYPAAGMMPEITDVM